MEEKTEKKKRSMQELIKDYEKYAKMLGECVYQRDYYNQEIVKLEQIMAQIHTQSNEITLEERTKNANISNSTDDKSFGNAKPVVGEAAQLCG